jgi:hypothetical protein
VYAWETLHRYAQFNPRWLESADAYRPGGEHLAVVREILPDDWSLRRLGMNVVAAPPGSYLPDQGWKLHVSAPSAEGAATLRAVVPVLRETRTRFKFIADRHLAFMVNSRTWSRGASGKFITVYPADDREFTELAALLADAVGDRTGPYVLSDARVPGSRSVYYRYGGFRPQWRLQPDGTRSACITTPDGSAVPDVRHPFFSPPAWAGDPFAGETADGATDESGGALGGGRYLVKSALRFTNRGGVYRALDTTTGGEVVLKEARPGVELGVSGADAITALEKEYELLTELRGSGHFVRPVEFFREWEHAFLVEHFVDGDHLGGLSITNNPLHWTAFTRADISAYHERMRPLWIQLAEAIGHAHQKGIVLGDVSFTNVLVDVTGDVERITVIDLEGAVRPGVDPPLPIYTRGLASERFARTGQADEANDWHALGGIILGSVALLHSMLGFRPSALEPVLASLTADLGLAPDLPALIRDLRAGGAYDAEEIRARIGALALTSPSAGAPLAYPAAPSLPGRLRAEVERTLAGIGDYLAGVADPGRADRVFPADLAVFETNPMSVAYGACGSAYALSQITGRVPGAVLGRLLSEPVRSADYPPGLYHGQAGIAWVLDELGHPEIAVRLLESACAHPLRSAEPGVLLGEAGVGLACLRLWERTGRESLLELAAGCGSRLIDRQEHDDRGGFWPGATGSVPVGYARGGSGVAVFLLALHAATRDERALAAGRAALDFDLAHAWHIDGRFAGFPPEAVAEGENPRLVKCYWDEGTAGVATAALRYAFVQGDPRLWEALAEILPDVRRKYAVLPQLFHGLAGMGNVLLDLYEFTGDEAHLREAWRTAEGVLLFRAERPEGHAFPGEQAMRESADLATGAAGVGLFLHRLLHARPGGRTNFNFVVDGLLPHGVRNAP